MPTLKQFKRDAHLPDSVRTWKQAAAHTALGQTALEVGREEAEARASAVTWPNGVHVDRAKAAGLTPGDFPVERFPIQGVELFAPTLDWREQHDVFHGDVLTLVAVPADTPQSRDHTRAPDGQWTVKERMDGLCLAGIEIELRDSAGAVLSSEEREHKGGLAIGLNMDQKLYGVLEPGTVLEGVTAAARLKWFFLKHGGVQGHLLPAGNGHLVGEWTVSEPCRLEAAWNEPGAEGPAVLYTVS